MRTPAPKVMMFGIDAGNRDLLQQWAAEGSLPTLDKLQNAGTALPIENDPGLYVGSVWPSFATGLRASGHGRYCYRQLKPRSYETPRYSVSALQDEPFWQAVSRAGRRVCVVDVPKTPLSHEINGVHVVDWGTHDPDIGFATSPPELADELRRQFGTDPLNGCCDADRSEVDEFQALRDSLLSRLRQRVQICRYLLNRGPWDLFIVCFPESHCAGHQFWHLHDAAHDRHPPEFTRLIGDPLKTIYMEIDRAIAQLMEAAGQPETTLVLTSHGMENHYTGTPLLEEILRRLHYTKGNEPRRGWAHFLMSGWTKLPGRLRYRLKPLRQQVEKILGFAEPSLGGAHRQRCFQVPNNDAYGAIRINLVGREPDGQVEPGEEFIAYREALRRDLQALVNDETCKPVVKNIWFADDIYRGKNQDCLPDLLIEWDKSAPINAISSPGIGRVARVLSGNRTGDHRNGGMLWATGRGIAENVRGASARMVDLAPTVCEMLNVPFTHGDGKAIESVCGTGQRSSK